jgi:transposase-like protein
VRYLRENFPYLVAFVKYPEEVRPYIYTTNLKRAGKEMKRRTKTIEVFSSEESLISVLYLVLGNENERLGQRRLRGFAKSRWEEEG